MHHGIRLLAATLLLATSFSASAQQGSRARPVATPASASIPAKPPVRNVVEVSSLDVGFENITQLAGQGWFFQNNSAPSGTNPVWFQGNPPSSGGPFAAFDGADNAYIAANFNSTAGGTGTISNWMVTPVLDFGAAATLSFYTRIYGVGQIYPDRLEVRYSTNGASTNVGVGATGVGDFGNVALSINPNLVTTGYPTTWTQFTVTQADGLPRSGTGRIAFRYFVTNAGPTGTNSDYIGIDRVVFNAGPPEYRLSGSVVGLAGSGLTLTLNDGTPLAVASNGAFQFPYTQSTSYEVEVLTQPGTPEQTCTVANGTGTFTGDVNNVQVTCVTDTFTVGGTVTGLLGNGLILQNNGGDNLAISADGAFTFATALDDLSAYGVTVAAQPGTPAQTCDVTAGSGNLAGADVTDVSVTCTTNTYTVGGSVSGLAGDGLVLQNNASDDLAITADGSFTFATALEDLSDYAVSVSQQPGGPSQTCVVADGDGALAGADVIDVAVTCTTDTFTIGGTVSGLLGAGLVLQNNAGDDLSIAADGSFTFATALEDESDYTVTVLTDPSLPAQACAVSGGDGALAGADVTDVAVTCVTEDFQLGIVSGGVQSADLGTDFAELLGVEVLDGDGAPVPDVAVTFEAPTTGASASLDDGEQAPGTTLAVETDASGAASVLATANGSAGCYGVTATAAGASASVVFELTNVDPVPPAPEIYEDGFETPPARAKGLPVCGQ